MISLPRALAFAAVLAASGLACNDITRPIAVAPKASRSFLTNPGGDIVISPDNMQGWAFTDDRTDAACSDTAVCRLVDGPVGAPQGSGSAELATTASSDAKALVLVDYQGTRLDHVTALRYSTYRQSADTGNNVAIALQFNAD